MTLRVARGVAWLLLTCMAPVEAQDFWSHWGDGRAELNGYRLTQPRYGAERAGTAVLIFVTEDFNDRLRVKAEGREPGAEKYPVMKLNEVRDFQTGIYDYNVMTSTFARVESGWPVAKVSFSSQEWCGHVYHQIVPRGHRVGGISHSYFEGEADGLETLDLPNGGVFADALPILLRGWRGSFLKPGERASVPLLPRLIDARMQHRPLAWGRAMISRAASDAEVEVPAGRFTTTRWTVAVDGGETLSYDIEVQPPYRLVRWSSSSGELAELLGSERIAYWKLTGTGGEAELAKLGLEPPTSSR